MAQEVRQLLTQNTYLLSPPNTYLCIPTGGIWHEKHASEAANRTRHAWGRDVSCPSCWLRVWHHSAGVTSLTQQSATCFYTNPRRHTSRVCQLLLKQHGRSTATSLPSYWGVTEKAPGRTGAHHSIGRNSDTTVELLLSHNQIRREFTRQFAQFSVWASGGTVRDFRMGERYIKCLRTLQCVPVLCNFSETIEVSINTPIKVSCDDAEYSLHSISLPAC